MMAYGLADWLRGADLRVEELAGWQQRGHGELAPANEIVDVSHHTAGSPYGRVPSLSTCVYGVAGVPGPLCNVVQTREPDGNDVFMVIAAGVSYNAGSGGFAGVQYNRSTIGTECEHTGIEPFPAHRAELRQRAAAAILKGLGQADGSRSCQHFEWSSAGKIDIGTPRVDANAWRARITEFMRGGAPSTPTAPSPPQGDEMQVVQYQTPFGTEARLVTGDGVTLDRWVGQPNMFGVLPNAVAGSPTGTPYRIIREADQAIRFVTWVTDATEAFDALHAND